MPKQKNSASLQSEYRRKPTQKRAIATVDAILEAVVILLEKEGYGALNTNKIADLAGVSIGTLYQYFPHREAIVQRLYANTISTVAMQARTVIFSRVNDDVKAALPTLIDTVLTLYESNKVVLIDLLDEVPELKKTLQGLSIEILIQSANRIYIAQQYPDMDNDKKEIAIHFSCATFIDHIHRYVLEKPEYLSRQMFIKNLTQMITCYLQDQ